MAGSLMDVFVKIGADTSGLESGIGKAKGLASGLGSAIGTGMKVVGAAVAGATTAVGAFAKSAINVGSTFDSSMSQVAATLGYTTEDIEKNVNGAGDSFEALRAKAEEAGRTTIFSASESAEGLNILAMSGYDAEQSIAMLDDVLHLAAAGSMDMASAAGYVSGAMKGFNDESKDAAYYADMMAKGATLANTSVSQLGDAMSSGAAGAASYGQSAESMTVALLRLAEQGETGSAAGTALAAAMKDIYTGTDQAKAALVELGVDAFDPISGEARDFNTVVNELEASMDGMTDEEKANYKQTIFGIQGLNAYNKMVVTSIDKQDEWADALANSAGEAEKQYSTMTDNLEGDVAGWNSALDGFKIAISEGAMGSIRQFVQFGTDGLSKITDAFKNGGLSGAMEALKGVLSDGIKMVTGMLPDAINAGVELLGAIGQGIIENLPALTEAAVSIAMQIVTGMVEAIPELATGLMTIIETLGASFEENASALQGIGQTLLQLIVRGVTEGIPMLASMALSLVQSLAAFLKENATTMAQTAGELIHSLITGLVEFLPELASSATDIIISLVLALTDPGMLTQLVMGAGELIMALANGLLEAIPKLLDAIPQIISNLVAALVAATPELIFVAIQLIIALATGLIQAIPRLVAAIPAIILALVGGLKRGIDQIVQVGRDMVAGLWKGIKERWKGLVEDFKNLATGLVDGIQKLFGIKSPSRVFAEIGKNLDAGLAKGINDNVDLVDRAMSNLEDYTEFNASGEFNASVNGGAQQWNQVIGLLQDIAEGGRLEVVLQEDADAMFRVMQRKSRVNKQITGQPSFA